MPRNLDLTALRSFVAMADTGGVTRAAGMLNLTQSAVSMQLKRLEESIGVGLIDRSGRSVGLTTAGEQLLGYARRMLRENDEVLSRLTSREFEGKLTLGVPHDIVYPAIPHVLRHFAAEYPRIQVQLVSSYTRQLKEQFADGTCDIIMTTEDHVGQAGELLTEEPLVWVGARDGVAWRDRPLRVAFENNCVFWEIARQALEKDGVPWESSVETASARTIEATVAADLAVTVQVHGTQAAQLGPVQHGGALPDLGSTNINLYVGKAEKKHALEDLAGMVRSAYWSGGQGPWAPAYKPPANGSDSAKSNRLR